MTEKTLYPFTDENRLENQNTYFYVPFGGKPFVEAWAQTRMQTLASIGNPKVREPSNPSETGPASVPAAARDLLGAMHHKISNATLSATEAGVLNKLLQRFEVTKRIHEHYPENFRPDKSVPYDDLQLYLLFAQVMDTAYASLGKLYYLNAMIKVLDTLSSVAGTLSADDQGVFAWLVGQEQKHIQALAEEQQVAI